MRPGFSNLVLLMLCLLKRSISLLRGQKYGSTLAIGSAFNFLACDEPQLNGNGSFKDQWLALRWIQSKI